jgi:hypothetical protein
MQDHEPSTLEDIWSGNVASGQLQGQSASLWDLLSRDREEVLLVRDPYAVRARTVLLSAIALVASFGLGWAGGLNWPEIASTLGLGSIARNQPASTQTSETRSGGRLESARKTAATSDLQTTAPAFVGTISRPPVTSGTHASAGAALHANAGPSALAVAVRQPLAPAPETRPTTIPGWTVVDVRDGAAVLDGPDGIRIAARGDIVPGLGRVDSIVRWGGRWIVATANGLVATP